MRSLIIWGQNHPFKTITFLAIAVTIGIVAANEDLSLLVAAVLLLVLCAVWAVVFRSDTKRVTTGGTP